MQDVLCTHMKSSIVIVTDCPEDDWQSTSSLLLRSRWNDASFNWVSCCCCWWRDLRASSSPSSSTSSSVALSSKHADPYHTRQRQRKDQSLRKSFTIIHIQTQIYDHWDQVFSPKKMWGRRDEMRDARASTIRDPFGQSANVPIRVHKFLYGQNGIHVSVNLKAQ